MNSLDREFDPDVNQWELYTRVKLLMITVDRSRVAGVLFGALVGTVGDGAIWRHRPLVLGYSRGSSLFARDSFVSL